MIDEGRLKDTFLEMVRIDSLSRREGKMLAYLKQRFDELGLEYKTDGAAKAIGGDAGNLIVYVPGNVPEAETLMFSAHMDTVEPGEGIEPIVEGDKIYAKGETILGGDDKSGIAALLEMVSVLKENEIAHGDIELVFTVCEEVGLQGAKNLDRSLVSAKYGFVLDGESICAATTKAPAALRYTATIHGKEAHAGVAPEKGINAVVLASRAIAAMPNGRIDEETTCNVGLIEAGRAANVVPPMAKIIGEIRSRDMAKLEKLKEEIFGAFRKVVEGISVETDGKVFEARAEISEDDFYPTMDVAEDAYTVRLARGVIEGWGEEFETKASGGGTDANLHNGSGIETIILGTGMKSIHSVDEHIHFSDIVAATRLVIGIVEANSGA